MAGGADIKLKGWKTLKALLNPTDFSATLKKNVDRATRYNAAFVRKEMRKRIKEAVYDGNAKLTILIKHASKSLIDDADLFNAITDVLVGGNSYARFVGVIRQAVGPDGETSLYNIARDLHEGMIITVTSSMRLLFQLLFEATQKVGARDDHGRFLKHAARVTPDFLTGRAREIFEQLKPGDKIYPLKTDTIQIVTKPRPYARAVFTDPYVLNFCKGNWNAAVAASFKKVGS
jgi:hypothetical protein